MNLPCRLCLLLALAFTTRLPAQVAPPGALPLLNDQALASARLTNSQGSDAVAEGVVRVSGQPFASGRRIETKRDLSPAWAVELHAPFVQASAGGDAALVHFFARSATAADESGQARLRVVVQKASADYDKEFQSEVSVGRDWQEFFLPFAFVHARANGEAELAFGFGYKRQTVEIGGIEVLNYGTKVALTALPKTRFTYPGREPEAAWRRAALHRIEQWRKGDFALRVIDAAGRPVVGATVRVEQRRSSFQWGSALQFARLVKASPDNQIYREKARELFNAASPENDLKWPVWNGDWGPGYEHEQSLAALRWLNEMKFFCPRPRARLARLERPAQNDRGATRFASAKGNPRARPGAHSR